MPPADFGTTPCLVSAISSRPIRRMSPCDACVLLCSNKSASTALQSGISSRLRERSKAPRAHARGILARIIHERFCCNRRSAALAREARDPKFEIQNLEFGISSPGNLQLRIPTFNSSDRRISHSTFLIPNLPTQHSEFSTPPSALLASSFHIPHF